MFFVVFSVFLFLISFYPPTQHLLNTCDVQVDGRRHNGIQRIYSLADLMGTRAFRYRMIEPCVLGLSGGINQDPFRYK